MNPATLKALRASIAHWKEMIEDGDGSPYADDCPLCQMFVLKTLTCAGCPVMRATGLSNCNGSPWVAASVALDESGYGDEFVEAASKELEFLESLLPKRKKKAR